MAWRYISSRCTLRRFKSFSLSIFHPISFLIITKLSLFFPATHSVFVVVCTWVDRAATVLQVSVSFSSTPCHAVSPFPFVSITVAGIDLLILYSFILSPEPEHYLPILDMVKCSSLSPFIPRTRQSPLPSHLSRRKEKRLVEKSLLSVYRMPLLTPGPPICELISRLCHRYSTLAELGGSSAKLHFSSSKCVSSDVHTESNPFSATHAVLEGSSTSRLASDAVQTLVHQSELTLNTAEEAEKFIRSIITLN